MLLFEARCPARQGCDGEEGLFQPYMYLGYGTDFDVRGQRTEGTSLRRWATSTGGVRIIARADRMTTTARRRTRRQRSSGTGEN